MKKVDSVVRCLITEIENKDILEVACGEAGFSIAASDYACQVSCIDLDDSRLAPVRGKNIRFEIMDAAKMRYADETFDAVFLYNALYHVRSQWETVRKECRRVLKPEGSIYLVGTWKLDIALLLEMFGDRAEHKGDFIIVRVPKTDNGNI